MQWGRGMAVIKIKGLTLIISASRENWWGGGSQVQTLPGLQSEFRSVHETLKQN